MYEKYSIPQANQSTLSKAFNVLDGVNYDILGTEIKDEDSFNTVRSEIYKIINDGILPFIKKYNSLKNVSELLAFKSAEEIVPYI
ncbi:MAG: hypothetical protein WBI17_14310, partial [Clostridiaceae bacterium]